MKALVHLAYGEKIPDCTRCANEEHLRHQYGCDAPALAVVFAVSCSGCGGTGCALCKETGAKEFHRCPGKLLEDSPHGRTVERAFRACAQYDASGVLPYAGGLSEQSASWCKSLEIYQFERGLIRKEEQEQAEKDAKRSKRRGI